MTQWRSLTFEPLDALANTDPRGLDDGGFALAGEISPLAFAGALRTAILHGAGYDFKNGATNSPAAKKAANVVGLTDETSKEFTFRLAGPQLVDHYGELYFPAPRRQLQLSAESPLEHPLAPRATDDWLADAALDGCCLLDDGCAQKTAPSDARVTAATLARLLLQGANDLDEAQDEWENLRGAGRSVCAPEWLHDERRVGHARNLQTDTVEIGRLYSRPMIRFEQNVLSGRFSSCGYCAFVAGVDETLLPDGEHTLRLGGDGRLTFVTVADAASAQQRLARFDILKAGVKKALPILRGLLLYLATPALFQTKGWRPDPAPAAGLRLIGAAVGRPRIIAGWDAKNKKPKPVCRAAPAGSVYYYVVGPGMSAADLENIVDRFTFNESLSDCYGNLGLGVALAGVWDARGRF